MSTGNRTATDQYPLYAFFPRWKQEECWVGDIVSIFDRNVGVLSTLDSDHAWNKSDDVLAIVRPDLMGLGFRVERGDPQAPTIHRPVLFGDNGAWALQYQIDAYDPTRNIALEIETGRTIQGNAIYRDLVHMSLLVDARFAVIAVPQLYRFGTGARQASIQPFKMCRAILDAIYSGRRLSLPFEGVLLLGY